MRKIIIFWILFIPRIIYGQIDNLTQLDDVIVIEPSFEKAGAFQEGLAPVMSNKKWGYINQAKTYVIKSQFDNAFSFSNGIALVYKTDGYIYINKQGKQAIAKKYVDANSFSEKLAIVDAKGVGEYAAIDPRGKQIFSAAPNYIKGYSEGLAPIQIKQKWGYINNSGKIVLKPLYEGGNNFSEGLAGVKLNGKWGFITKKGNMSISPSFSLVKSFHNNFCAVKQNNTWGFIDKSGKQVIDFIYEEATDFSEGLAAVKIKGKWGYIDKVGNLVVKPILDYASVFSEGFACIGLNKQSKLLYGYIKNPLTLVSHTKDIEGENQSKITPPQKAISPPKENLADSKFMLCDEWASGWEGNISNIHQVVVMDGKINLKWKYVNGKYGIIIYEGKGLKGTPIFKEKNIRYTGEKSIQVKTRRSSAIVTVQILARKEGTEWEYLIECG